MKFQSVNAKFTFLMAGLAVSLALGPQSLAQGGGNSGPQIKEEQQNGDQQLKQRALNQGSQNQDNQKVTPKVDPKEQADYKAFYDVSPQDADKKLQLGQDFVQKYPMSKYLESVYAGLVQAYYLKQDWKNFYATADKALALNADDAGVLTMVGWVIPHVYNPNDPDAPKSLDKAEQYEKHAIQVIETMPKPPAMTDDQFTQSKTSLLEQAHSGLGLVYFRRQQSEDSVKELQQATQGAAKPDPTDFFVMGIDLQSLGRNAEAVDAFNRCAEISSGLQDRCKQSADSAKKQSAQTK
jgi:tetratricopeptide (TPR) repeat protein